MLDYTKYMNPHKYPTKLSIPRLVSNTPTEAEINKYLSEVKEFDKAKVEYEKNLAAHQEAKAERLRQFKIDLFVAYGVTGHPKAEKAFNLAKAEKAFNLAWEFGHSAGLYEVELYFSTLAALIKH